MARCPRRARSRRREFPGPISILRTKGREFALEVTATSWTSRPSCGALRKEQAGLGPKLPMELELRAGQERGGLFLLMARGILNRFRLGGRGSSGAMVLAQSLHGNSFREETTLS